MVPTVFLRQPYSGPSPVRLFEICLLSLLLSYAAGCHSFQPTAASFPKTIPATGTIQVAFTPGDDATQLIVDAIAGARYEILVQAFSFTNQKIADALIASQKRNIQVKIIADRGQIKKMERGLIPYLASQGITVFVDSKHDAAHNKVIVIDHDSERPVLVTGSFNFTHAAQSRNAENLLIIRGNQRLTQAYLENWQRHHSHATPYLIP